MKLQLYRKQDGKTVEAKMQVTVKGKRKRSRWAYAAEYEAWPCTWRMQPDILAALFEP